MTNNDIILKLEELLEVCEYYKNSISSLDDLDKPLSDIELAPVLKKIISIYAEVSDTIKKYSKFDGKVIMNQNYWNMWSIYDVAFANYEIYYVWSSLDHVVWDLSFIISKLKSMPSKDVAVTADFWSLIHPDIIKVAKSRFDSGHYADAVEAAFKEVNSIVKKILKDKQSVEKDWATLMNHVFSLENPVVALWDLWSEDGKNMQKWYMQIFAWSMTWIRNPKAHSNWDLGKEKCIHFLFLASLLRIKIDEGNVL